MPCSAKASANSFATAAVQSAETVTIFSKTVEALLWSDAFALSHALILPPWRMPNRLIPLAIFLATCLAICSLVKGPWTRPAVASSIVLSYTARTSGADATHAASRAISLSSSSCHASLSRSAMSNSAKSMSAKSHHPDGGMSPIASKPVTSESARSSAAGACAAVAMT